MSRRQRAASCLQLEFDLEGIGTVSTAPSPEPGANPTLETGATVSVVIAEVEPATQPTSEAKAPEPAVAGTELAAGEAPVAKATGAGKGRQSGKGDRSGQKRTTPRAFPNRARRSVGVKLTEEERRAMIERFIREKGVTKCKTMYAAGSVQSTYFAGLDGF